MRFEEENQAANQAAYSNLQHRHPHGFGVISGGNVTVNTGNLDQSDTLSLEASDILVAGTEYSLASQAIQINSTNTNTRRDIIYVDSSGNVQVAEGTEKEPQTTVTNPDYVDYVFPTPPDLAHVDATVLWEVWVPNGNSTITSSELLDRRESAEIVTDTVESSQLTGSVAGGNTLTNLLGQGLEAASGAVQVLSTIWDGSNIVADVDNQSVTTDISIVASELGLPEYDDVSNAPQTQGRLVYATGDGASTEGIYKHDGTGYTTVGLNEGENFDGQGTSQFSNLQSLSTGRATIAGTSMLSGQSSEVGTSATTIYSTSAGEFSQKGLLLVFTSGGGFDEWVDLVLFNESASSRVGQLSKGGSPTRNYDVDGSGVTLELGSGTQTVNATAIEDF